MQCCVVVTLSTIHPCSHPTFTSPFTHGWVANQAYWAQAQVAITSTLLVLKALSHFSHSPLHAHDHIHINTLNHSCPYLQYLMCET